MGTEAIHLNDLVALLDDLGARSESDDRPLLLRRGQIGTVADKLGNEAAIVEFIDDEGYTYALATVPLSQLMILHERPDRIAS